MNTPQKRNKSNYVQTTVDSQATKQGISRYVSNQTKTSRLINYGDLKDVKKRIIFQEPPRQRIKTEVNDKPDNNNCYNRKNMINYLNSKFTAVFPGTPLRHHNKQIKQTQLSQRRKIQNRINTLFTQYMDNIRILKIKGMNQFYLGSILQKMSFINNILFERATITKICKQLQTATILSVFLFIIHLYIRPQLQEKDDEKDENRSHRIKHIQHLFAQQGLNYSIRQMEQFDSLIMTFAYSQEYRELVSNRQNRHTICSFSRSISRGKA